MERLSGSDFRALLSALEQLNSDISLETLPERTLAAVGAAISADIIGFAGFDDRGAPSADNWSTQTLSPDELEAFAANIAEHPSFGAVVLGKRVEALKITDFATLNEFRQTNLYNEFYRRIGIERQMTIRLPESNERFFSCALNRQKRDFSGRERQMLELLAPHLTLAFRSAFKLDQIERRQCALLGAFEKLSQGVVVVGANGEVNFISEAAENFLTKYFAFESRNGASLPEEISAAVSYFAGIQSQLAAIEAAAPPMIFRTPIGELRASFSYNGGTGETIVILEEKEALSPSDFELLGLTKREAEVLFLVTQGKTNQEIGILCGISWRTAQKHLEHIFDKLGVETRTAATVAALERLSKTIY